jgi:hypothetical protein
MLGLAPLAGLRLKSGCSSSRGPLGPGNVWGVSRRRDPLQFFPEHSA